MAEHLKLIRPCAAPPARGEFIETETARDIMRTLGRVERQSGEERKVGLICGAPGVGKSATLQHFIGQAPRMIFHRAVAAEGGTWNTAIALSKALNMPEPNGRKMEETRLSIADAIVNAVGVTGMLIIDEAQYLVPRNQRGKDDWSVMEWLRRLADDSMIPLVLSGDLRLREIERELPQLWRRMQRTIITKTPRNDVAAISARWGITDPKMVDQLFAVSRRSGGALGAVAEVCEETRVMAGAREPVMNDVLAALESLGMLSLGGK